MEKRGKAGNRIDVAFNALDPQDANAAGDFWLIGEWFGRVTWPLLLVGIVAGWLEEWAGLGCLAALAWGLVMLNSRRRR